MKYKAVGHRVLIKPDPVTKEHRVGGSDLRIILAQDEKMQRAATQTGTVIDVGPTAWQGFGDNQPWAGIGDKVVFARYSGKFLENPDNPDESYVVVNDEDIQLRIEE